MARLRCIVTLLVGWVLVAATAMAELRLTAPESVGMSKERLERSTRLPAGMSTKASWRV
jgi:hypothetical protein